MAFAMGANRRMSPARRYVAGATGPAGPQGATGATGPALGNAYRAGQVGATKSSNTHTYTYGTALPAGTYVTTVAIFGNQNLGFTGNGTQGHIVVLTSTNTGFTFDFEDLSGGTQLTLGSNAPTTLQISYISIAAQ